MTGPDVVSVSALRLQSLETELDGSRATVAAAHLEIAALQAQLAELRSCGLPSPTTLRNYRAALATLQAEQARHAAERSSRGSGTPSDARFGDAVIAHSKAMAALVAEVVR